ncbi:MAG: Asp-tRNA(Asn)/Glu-tRNA(Gln) amidotransferase subunit GatC [Deltaproteobacteria bacterium]|jgi:aspartyl-tRNA(Asn)/glutamyl-tRNA(Gln) amidotransferase subunit C|nr:Asp-tRNA(Asn)/Glu-tRNA(Gln) amidotransferase subunit GatC [Deltaproteobacteria bacterium]
MTNNRQAALSMAKLARLGQTQSEASQADQLAQDFDRIVSYMAILNELDTTNIEPMYSPMVDPLGPRDDEPRPSQPQKSEAILGQAPETVGRFFSVPRIF